MIASFYVFRHYIILSKILLLGDCHMFDFFYLFNYGNCKRDFTYVDDIVEGVVRVMQKAPEWYNEFYLG